MVFFCLVAFFGIVIGVNAIMIRAAVSTFGGVETESSYQAGLAFGRETANAAAQDALHWDVAATIAKRDGGAVVEVVARDSAAHPLRGITATAQLAHPTDSRADRSVALTEGAPGVFRGTTAELVGQWDLVIDLSRDGERLFRSKNRIIIR
jgi:nitrogen fixation protein FixH